MHPITRTLGLVAAATVASLTCGVVAENHAEGNVSAVESRAQIRHAGIIYARAGAVTEGDDSVVVRSGIVEIEGEQPEIVMNARTVAGEWALGLQREMNGFAFHSWRITIIHVDSAGSIEPPIESMVPALPEVETDRQVAFAVWLQPMDDGVLASPAFWFDAQQDSRLTFAAMTSRGEQVENIKFELAAKQKAKGGDEHEYVTLGRNLAHGGTLRIRPETSDRLEDQRWFRVIKAELPADHTGDDAVWIIAYRE